MPSILGILGMEQQRSSVGHSLLPLSQRKEPLVRMAFLRIQRVPKTQGMSLIMVLDLDSEVRPIEPVWRPKGDD